MPYQLFLSIEVFGLSPPWVSYAFQRGEVLVRENRYQLVRRLSYLLKGVPHFTACHTHRWPRIGNTPPGIQALTSQIGSGTFFKTHPPPRQTPILVRESALICSRLPSS
jgi:hypothetical protein